MFWCFSCYAVDDLRTGPCRVCGEPIEGPPSLSRAEILIWALRHPDGDRAVLAARALGWLRAREGIPALRGAAEAGKDIYLRAEALRSLIAIEGAEALGPWLEDLSRGGPFNVRAIALEALAGQDEASP